MEYFDNCSNLDELKKAYRRFVMQYHLGCGSNGEIMKQINDEEPPN